MGIRFCHPHGRYGVFATKVGVFFILPDRLFQVYSTRVHPFESPMDQPEGQVIIRMVGTKPYQFPDLVESSIPVFPVDVI
jgi:hypothetical protein